jgi:hypothetical protein
VQTKRWDNRGSQTLFQLGFEKRILFSRSGAKPKRACLALPVRSGRTGKFMLPQSMPRCFNPYLPNPSVPRPAPIKSDSVSCCLVNRTPTNLLMPCSSMVTPYRTSAFAIVRLLWVITTNWL